MITLPAAPRIKAQRLALRPFCLYDATAYQQIMNHPEVSATADLPYPYPIEQVRDWMIGHPKGWSERGELFLWAGDAETRQVYGSGNLFYCARNKKAEIGYLIGREYWGNGYATEIAAALLDFAFNKLDVHRVEGYHFSANPASARVLEKLGFIYEGTMRKLFFKNGVYEDMTLRSILREEYEQQARHPKIQYQ